MPKISELNTITGANLAPGDKIEIVDVSDFTMAPTGTNKQAAVSDLNKIAGAAASDVMFSTKVAGDAQDRIQIRADGSVRQGDGANPPMLPLSPYYFALDGAQETMGRWEPNGYFSATINRMTTTHFVANATRTVTQVWTETGTGTSTVTGTRNQVQTLTMTGSPTGGTFTLTFNGQTTAPIAHNASNNAIRDALTALSNVGLTPATPFAYNPYNQYKVSIGGGPLPGTPVTVTFQYNLGVTNHPVMTANSSGLTGGTTPTMTPSITTTGQNRILMAKWGLFQLNADYDAMLVGETVNDRTLFGISNTSAGTRANFTSPVQLVQGTHYALGLLVRAGYRTTITAPSNGAVLPQGTINVSDTTEFASSGTIYVQLTSGQYQTITYTGKTATTFTGCTGGTGTLATGNGVEINGVQGDLPSNIIVGHAYGGGTPRLGLSPVMAIRLDNQVDIPQAGQVGTMAFQISRSQLTVNGVYTNARFYAFLV